MRNKPRKAEFCCLISRRRLRLSHELFLALQTVDTIHSKVTTFPGFPSIPASTVGELGEAPLPSKKALVPASSQTVEYERTAGSKLDQTRGVHVRLWTPFPPLRGEKAGNPDPARKLRALCRTHQSVQQDSERSDPSICTMRVHTRSLKQTGAIGEQKRQAPLCGRGSASASACLWLPRGTGTRSFQSGRQPPRVCEFVRA